MKHFSTRQLTHAAIIAALYAVLAIGASVFGITYGPIQCRVSEALCVLPFFFPEAVPGLFIGCLIANILSPYGALDIIFGSLATLLAAMATAKMRKKWLAPLPPVIANGLIIGAVISFEQVGFNASFLPAFAFNGITIAVGEAIACYVFGGILLKVLPKIKYFKDYISKNRVE